MVEGSGWFEYHDLACGNFVVQVPLRKPALPVIWGGCLEDFFSV